MEFSALIDSLDDLVTNAKKARLSSDVRLEREEARAIVDQLRGAIPEELKQAHWIAENRDEMLAEAKDEMARMLEEAREERARLLGREQISAAAEQRARQLVEDARAQGQELLTDAEGYAGDVLGGLETNLVKLVDAVARGRERLAERGEDRVVRGGDEVVERGAALVA